jgi:ABC-type transporter Mla MlaB component
MAKDENGGLLSKVVKFVRNPTTNWADLDQPDSDRESTYSKAALKEMIERKRRNDFVRKREFDMLRKMRKREALTGTDFAARPSFFQSSMPSKPDDRAMTIKKIDEIEAQMSMQWWKTKNGAEGGNESSGPMTSQFAASAVDSSGLGELPSITNPEQAAHYAPTDPGPLAVGSRTSGAPLSSRSAGFMASSSDAIEVDEYAHDPELEEAAIRFANGDDEGAEAGLLEALSDKGTRSKHLETWMTLFDLYRATGEAERFERAAIDFASRFGRSAPQWFSMPALIDTLSSRDEASVGVQPAHWASPSTVGVQTLAVLNAALGRATPPWRLDWSRLTTIEPAALNPLFKLFQGWASQTVQLRFIGADRLEELLEKATPPNDKSVEALWWRLRMEALRLMGRSEDFELVALNYCVTYEVSPPSWESARCDYKPLGADGGYLPGHTIVGTLSTNSVMNSLSGGASEFHATTMDSQQMPVSAVELSGSILGDATGWVEQIEAKLGSADLIVVSCPRLIRVDFSAAGTLLNWVTARQAEGRTVQFTDVHRLVASFFSVIGIGESSRVSLRPE